MMELINWFSVHVPWWSYLILFGFVAVGLAIAAKVYNINIPAPVLTALAVVAALIVAFAKATQKGYALRKADEQTADTKARDEFDQIHKKDESLNDAQLDQKNDPWLKP